MLNARITVLPPVHPATVLFQIAMGSTLPSLASDVSTLKSRASFCNPVPDITSCYTADEILGFPRDTLGGNACCEHTNIISCVLCCSFMTMHT